MRLRPGQLPAVCATGPAVTAGPSSARSMSSKVGPLGSGPNTQKPIRPRPESCHERNQIPGLLRLTPGGIPV